MPIVEIESEQIDFNAIWRTTLESTFTDEELFESNCYDILLTEILKCYQPKHWDHWPWTQVDGKWVTTFPQCFYCERLPRLRAEVSCGFCPHPDWVIWKFSKALVAQTSGEASILNRIEYVYVPACLDCSVRLDARPEFITLGQQRRFIKVACREKRYYNNIKFSTEHVYVNKIEYWGNNQLRYTCYYRPAGWQTKYGKLYIIRPLGSENNKRNLK